MLSVHLHSDVINLLSRGNFGLPHLSEANNIPYFFGYKTEFFSFQNNPKDQEIFGIVRRI